MHLHSLMIFQGTLGFTFLSFATFKTFKAFVEKQSSYSIKKLRTDNGGEYVNKAFMEFCKAQGIHRQHAVPYTPQQNGVTERKKRTLKEMANYMIQSNVSYVYSLRFSYVGGVRVQM